MRILIADDDIEIRRLLTRTLKKWGHEAVAAENGAEAWKILQREGISFVISDWVMPKMDGLDLCKKIRAAYFPRYIYIILLTAKDAKKELIEGMEAGADDFVVKPFNKGELKVRIRAGERILRLEKDLEERNRKLREVYSQLRKDLEAGAKMQKSLLPSAATSISGVKFEWLFLPCAFLAGDIFNFFDLDEHHVGFFLLDVAGHGIPSALLSVTLSKMLSPYPSQDSRLKHFVPNSTDYKIVPPAKVIRDLNRSFQSEHDAMHYFTMVYGVIDTQNRKIRMSQAGHPSPIFLRHGDSISLIGTGGFPVGMLPGIKYEEEEFDFRQGDRLFVYSDGITECMNESKQQFSVKRLTRLLEECQELPLQALMRRLEDCLRSWKGNDKFEDDITLLAMEGVSLGNHL
jgi:sigma-B regulation protein RsbU (phosphoserine phosphatase)